MLLDFEERNDELWDEVINDLFMGETPSEVTWVSQEQIIRVLNVIGGHKSLNHSFFPDCGGFEFNICKISSEKQCLELRFTGSIVVLNVAKLTFNSMNSRSQKSSYFTIHMEKLKPSGVYEEKLSEYYETVSELEEGVYVESSAYEEGYWGLDGYAEPKKVPSNTRQLRRYFKGKILMVSKSSYYNNDNCTYDGRHEKMNDTELLEYISELDETMHKST